MPTKHISGEFVEYRMGPNFGPVGRCQVQLYRPSTGFSVFVATELINNLGPSITNAAENAFLSACKAFGVDPFALGTVWIEHYPRSEDRDDTFDLVDFEVHAGVPVHPSWRHLKLEEALRITGATVDELTGHGPFPEAVKDERQIIFEQAVQDALDAGDDEVTDE